MNSDPKNPFPPFVQWRKDKIVNVASLINDQNVKRDLRLAKEVTGKIRDQGGMALVVGGFVRDLMLRRLGYEVRPKDVDLEVYGLEQTELAKVLETARERVGGSEEQVGKSFGVYKLGGLDIAQARLEMKSEPGLGRKPETQSRPDLDFSQAAKRRDLTVNALGLDLLTGDVYDAYGGIEDLKARLLRHVDAETFVDDPLRVYRVMRFSAGLGFSVAPETLELCSHIPLDYLAAERIGYEWDLAVAKSSQPSLGLRFAQECGILRQKHPGLQALFDVTRGKITGWESMLRSLDMTATIIRKKSLSWNEARALAYAVLAYGLDADAEVFFKEIKLPVDIKAAALVLAHQIDGVRALMRLAGKKEWTADNDTALRQLSVALGKSKMQLSFVDAVNAAWAVQVGELRPGSAEISGLVSKNPAGERLIKRAKVLHATDGAPKCVLVGADLAGLGVPNGKRMGEILKDVMEKQLSGLFDDSKHVPQKEQALEYVRGLLGS